MRKLLASIACLSLAGGNAAAQGDSLAPRNEFLVLVENSSFTDPARADHRTLGAEYYWAQGRTLKLFGGFSAFRKFDTNDRSVALGGYFTLNRENSFFGSLSLGISPTFIPKYDFRVEYSRLLTSRLIGILGYREMSYTSDRVHMLVAGADVYEIRRWTFTPEFFLARLSSETRLRPTFFLHVTLEMSTRLVPELYYSVGSEAYRAESVDYVTSEHAWALAVGGRILLSDVLRLRVHYRHGVRAGFFEENAVDAAVSYLW